MGNEINSPDIRTEYHTDSEEQPLHTQNIAIPDTETNEITSNIHIIQKTIPAILPLLPVGWEQRIDPQTHKVYYVDHNTHSTQWNPPNTITKVGNKWTTHNNENDKANIIIHNETNKVNQFSDCWDLENPTSDPYVIFNENLCNTIRLKPRNASDSKKWVSVFGTKIVTKGEYKRWQIKILPHNITAKHTKKAVKCMIGIVDINSISEQERGNAIQSEYWLLPRIGYCFGGEKGKKYHIEKKGKSYAHKYKIGDIITVELNRTSNRYIMHNDLRFYTNEKVNRLAFNIDNDRNYVLAIAMCDTNYEIQIYD